MKSNNYKSILASIWLSTMCAVSIAPGQAQAAVPSGHTKDVQSSAETEKMNIKLAAVSKVANATTIKATSTSNPATASVKALALSKSAEASLTNTASSPSITDYGDGVQLIHYTDNRGFAITGGGCSALYDSNTKTMTMIDQNGVSQQVRFGN